jgi:SAM-dependent methyltransferase
VRNGTDWLAWHEPYQDPGSPLSRRLRIVQDHIGRWLDSRPEGPVTVLSVCAGQGQDLIEVLGRRTDSGRVRATLLEHDDRNVRAARAAADRAGLTGIDVREADAGDLASYRDAVPADLILLAGVFGNISEPDIRTTIRALPALCRPAATVIWTRTRRPPDRTGAVRTWLGAAGFTEDAFHAPEDVLFSVGVHRLIRTPPAATTTGRLFTFIV